MKQSVKNKPANILVKSQRFRFASLIICGLRGDKNIAEITPIPRKRQNISRLVKAAVLSIVMLHCFIGNQYDREWMILDAQFRYECGNKSAHVLSINCVLPLFIDEDVFRSCFRLFVQTEAIAAAPCFARNMSHKLARYAVRADGARRLVR